MSKIYKNLTKLIKRERGLKLLKLEMKREPIQQMPTEFRKITKACFEKYIPWTGKVFKSGFFLSKFNTQMLNQGET